MLGNSFEKLFSYMYMNLVTSYNLDTTNYGKQTDVQMEGLTDGPILIYPPSGAYNRNTTGKRLTLSCL